MVGVGAAAHAREHEIGEHAVSAAPARVFLGELGAARGAEDGDAGLRIGDGGEEPVRLERADAAATAEPDASRMAGVGEKEDMLHVGVAHRLLDVCVGEPRAPHVARAHIVLAK